MKRLIRSADPSLHSELLHLWEAAEHVSRDPSEQSASYYLWTKRFNQILDNLKARKESKCKSTT